MLLTPLIGVIISHRLVIDTIPVGDTTHQSVHRTMHSYVHIWQDKANELTPYYSLCYDIN